MLNLMLYCSSEKLYIIGFTDGKSLGPLMPTTTSSLREPRRRSRTRPQSQHTPPNHLSWFTNSTIIRCGRNGHVTAQVNNALGHEQALEFDNFSIEQPKMTKKPSFKIELLTDQFFVDKFFFIFLNINCLNEKKFY